jgi:hypothetical protein
MTEILMTIALGAAILSVPFLLMLLTIAADPETW